MKVQEAYMKLVQNKHFISEMSPYLRAEVREFAVQRSMLAVEVCSRICQVESNIKNLEPMAVGYDSVLSYLLANNIDHTRAEAVIKLIDDLRKGRKRTDIHSGLRLSDILKDGITTEMVKSWYRNPDHIRSYAGMFFRVLRDKGYFNRKVTAKELEIIISNEFIPGYKDSRNYRPPADLSRSEFKHIP